MRRGDFVQVLRRLRAAGTRRSGIAAVALATFAGGALFNPIVATETAPGAAVRPTAGTHSTAEAPSTVEAPSPLDLTVRLSSPVPLSASTLSALQTLDLSQPATKPTAPLVLVAPSNSTSEKITQPEQTSPSRSTEKPPAFNPQWRTARRSPVAKSFTLPVSPGLTMPPSQESTSPKIDRPEPDDQPEAWVEDKTEPQLLGKKTPSNDSAKSADTEVKTTPAPADRSQPESKQQDVETAPPVVVLEPAKPLKPLTRNQRFLRNKLRKVLVHYSRQPLNSRDHDSWEAMHGMLAYGLQSQIRNGGPRGKSTTAIGWLCYNNSCKRKQLMRLNADGEIRAQYGVGLQGHMGQFLAMLAQCNLDPSYPIRVEGQDFTVEDLIVAEQKTCYTKTELTFKLIGLMHYLPSDATWINDRGEEWSIERLIKEEMSQPIRGVACGGTHRLGGLSMAVRKRAERGEPINGAYLQASQFTKRYENYAFRLQNSDGSLSTEWFRGPGRERSIDRRIRTSGHLLEWLLVQVPDEQLGSYKVTKGVNYLTNLLYENTRNEWEVGPLSHALHALALYDQRMFQPHGMLTNLAGESRQGNPAARSSSTQRSSTARHPSHRRSR